MKSVIMLARQKILLLMLKHAGRPVQRLELMKWCFLLRHESETAGGSSFYDFVPYKYLLDYVYQHYPAFTINSDWRKLAPRPEGKPAVTAGEKT